MAYEKLIYKCVMKRFLRLFVIIHVWGWCCTLERQIAKFALISSEDYRLQQRKRIVVNREKDWLIYLVNTYFPYGQAEKKNRPSWYWQQV